ncbi:MAG: hypothetical protein H7256_05455 [Bdellovibrio sp.]|nr:hypothetical protein [Bdellovibrio sp.]
MKLSKHFKVALTLLGLMAVALTMAFSVANGGLITGSLIKTAQEEVQCDFKQDIFQQWAYIFGKRTSCVYR